MEAKRMRWRAWAAAAMLACPASAGEGPVGPCSPWHGADGDVPSEMPGCAHRLRPAPGSLGDELEFRRARGSPEGDDAPEDEEVPARRRKRPR